LVAGSESIACASFASMRSKTGSPRAGGTPVQTVVSVPPIESFASLTCRMSVAILHDVGGCGQRSETRSSVSHAAMFAGGSAMRSPERV
jgi:hypothetical protein